MDSNRELVMLVEDEVAMILTYIFQRFKNLGFNSNLGAQGELLDYT